MGNLFSSATSRHDDVCGQWFDHADANKDGFVDCSEWAAAMKPFLAEAGIAEGNRPGMHQELTGFLQRSGATLQHNDSDKMNREQFVKAMKTFRCCKAAKAYDGEEMEARTQQLTSMLQAAKEA